MRVLGSGPKSYIPMLGTALLARATDARIDPFALKTRTHKRAYSARSLCKDVLVPCAVEAHVHLGTTGREPLNNQPFFRHERVSRDMVVHASARESLGQLCDALDAIRDLDEADALDALAAFLRVRIEDAPRSPAAWSVERVSGPPELITEIARFIASNPENGKRGQALVAACLDLIHDDVRTTRVFDPSRRWPGDVVVLANDEITIAVEVKQRPATETEILQFTERCAEMGVHRAIAATLDQLKVPLDEDRLQEDAWRQYGVHLSLLQGASPLVRAALTWTSLSLDRARSELPHRVAARLVEVEASQEALEEWVGLFRAATVPGLK